MSVRIMLFENRVLIRAKKPEEKTKGGILIPEIAQTEQTNVGVVVATGPGRTLEDGSVVPTKVKVDDEVYYSAYGGETYKEDGENFLLLRDTDIVGVFAS